MDNSRPILVRIRKKNNLIFDTDLLSGKTHILFFKSVRPEHAGEIRFTAERVSSYATLTVKGERPDIPHI